MLNLLGLSPPLFNAIAAAPQPPPYWGQIARAIAAAPQKRKLKSLFDNILGNV